MQQQAFRKYVAVLLAGLMVLLAVTQCAPAPAATPGEQPAAGQAAQVAAVTDSCANAVEQAKQYAGATINVVWESGLQPEDPKIFAPRFSELTGVNVNIVEIPYVDIFTKQLQDYLTGGGAYDVVTLAPIWLTDLVNAGALEPLNPYIDKYMNKADLEDYLGVYGSDGYARIGDTWYGLPDDGDVFVMYYRKDLFEDPANQEEFKASYGYELAPPKTYQEFDDVGRFFTDKYSAQGIYGGAFQHLEGQAWDWFVGPFSGAGGQFFDPQSMDATINSETGVDVLTNMVKVSSWMPPGVQKWGFTEVLSAWLDGKLAMIITWPPVGRWSEGVGKGTEQLSWVPETKVAGNVGYAPEPGGRSALAGGFALGVSPNSQNKDAAYLFAQWMNCPATSLERVMLPFALRDPFRKSHFASEQYRALWPTANEYLETLESAAGQGQLELGIPGGREYMVALDQAITAAYAGADPKAALDEAAEKFNAITDRLGRDKQKEAYSQWLHCQWAQSGPRQ
ncbi:MAG: sugar ABC transporter substrate-binding protein [Caldilineaceae bacterium]|nr:sugar ABC transporter substrate-binding protein [Caldilineaceae bacterium]